MKNDLDNLMRNNNLDAIAVFGSISEPAFAYLTDGAEVSDGLFVKTKDGPSVIWLWFLDRKGVKNPDIEVKLFDRGLYKQVFEETKSRELADLEVYFKGFEDLKGGAKRIAVYGRLEFSFGKSLGSELGKRYPEFEIVADKTPNIIERSRATKSPEELAKLIDVGRKTSSVMIDTRDFIRSHTIHGDVFTKPDDSPLTVGDVKSYARLKLAETNLEDSDGMIFAPGKQGIVGHYTGEQKTPIRLGEPIIFDLFPRESKGFYHDITRTWCFGHAPDDIQAIYADVTGCFDLVKKEAVSGIQTGALQDIACDYFRERNHPVIKDDPELTDGYNHALGHGVGLNVHELPFFGLEDKDTLSEGNTFALEPGLYYTKRGLAARIEDTFYINSEGTSVSVSEVPYDLVIPVS